MKSLPSPPRPELTLYTYLELQVVQLGKKSESHLDWPKKTIIGSLAEPIACLLPARYSPLEHQPRDNNC